MARDRFALASVGLAAALLSGVAHGVPTTAATGAFEDVRVAPYGAEAAITTGPDDTLYLAIPGSDGPDFFRSADQGRTWIQGATADTRDGAGGDNGLATDSAGAIYEVNSGVLSYSSDGRRDEILGADVYRSINGGSSWPQRGRSILDQGSNTLPQDRPWVGAWLPPGDRPADTRVYLVYKDVVTSEIWVVRSRDAGAHFGAPILVSASPLAFQAAACSAYPGGVRVVQSGPHAGRVYIAWTGGDIATNASTGCYFTMLNTEHTVWVSWSDD